MYGCVSVDMWVCMYGYDVCVLCVCIYVWVYRHVWGCVCRRYTSMYGCVNNSCNWYMGIYQSINLRCITDRVSLVPQDNRMYSSRSP